VKRRTRSFHEIKKAKKSVGTPIEEEMEEGSEAISIPVVFVAKAALKRIWDYVQEKPCRPPEKENPPAAALTSLGYSIEECTAALNHSEQSLNIAAALLFQESLSDRDKADTTATARRAKTKKPSKPFTRKRMIYGSSSSSSPSPKRTSSHLPKVLLEAAPKPETHLMEFTISNPREEGSPLPALLSFLSHQSQSQSYLITSLTLLITPVILTESSLAILYAREALIMMLHHAASPIKFSIFSSPTVFLEVLNLGIIADQWSSPRTNYRKILSGVLASFLRSDNRLPLLLTQEIIGHLIRASYAKEDSSTPEQPSSSSSPPNMFEKPNFDVPLWMLEQLITHGNNFFSPLLLKALTTCWQVTTGEIRTRICQVLARLLQTTKSFDHSELKEFKDHMNEIRAEEKEVPSSKYFQTIVELVAVVDSDYEKIMTSNWTWDTHPSKRSDAIYVSDDRLTISRPFTGGSNPAVMATEPLTKENCSFRVRINKLGKWAGIGVADAKFSINGGNTLGTQTGNTINSAYFWQNSGIRKIQMTSESHKEVAPININDVIGVKIDFDQQKILYWLNDQFQGSITSKKRKLKEGKLFPCANISVGTEVSFVNNTAPTFFDNTTRVREPSEEPAFPSKTHTHSFLHFLIENL
jgi:hypothetical protein